MTGISGGGISLPPFFDLQYFDSIDSTNLHLRELAEKGAREGSLIWAGIQQSGVGRRGRHWSSPAGNLYCSLLLRPAKTVSEAAQLSFVTAVALEEAIASFLPGGVQPGLKWPNDILFDGRKLAGILLESKSRADGQVDWVIVGTGVNIASYPDVTDGLEAVSLKSAGGNVKIAVLLERYASSMLKWYFLWLEQGFAPVRTAWLAHAHGLGKRLKVRLPSRTFEGVFSGLDEKGVLQLTTDDGKIIPVSAGEVFFS